MNDGFMPRGLFVLAIGGLTVRKRGERNIMQDVKRVDVYIFMMERTLRRPELLLSLESQHNAMRY
jgi:hypothetical protein